MNFAQLPWEQLQPELDRFAALPLAERKRQADGPGQGAPLDIFLHAARRIATTTDPSPARTPYITNTSAAQPIAAQCITCFSAGHLRDDVSAQSYHLP